MGLQALARTIWGVVLVLIVSMTALAVVTSSRTGLEVSPLPSALYAAALAFAVVAAGASALMPRLLLSDDRLVGFIEQAGGSAYPREGLPRIYLRQFLLRMALNVAVVALGFGFVNETLTAAPIIPFAVVALGVHVLAFPRLHLLLERIAELEDELDHA